jgi:5-methyltetrahydrofolate--homocysteine methyltransferase
VNPLLKLLADNHIILADGGLGTELQRAGLPRNIAPERWNLENPEAVQQVHRAYAETGSQLILTNTLGGNRFRLRMAGLSGQVIEINRQAVQLARRAAKNAVIVGSLGPTGLCFAPNGSLTWERCLSAYAEQAQILVEAGVDALLVETMVDLAEAQAAVAGVQSVTDLPLMATVVVDKKGHMFMGAGPDEIVDRLWGMGLVAVGANCGSSMEGMIALACGMRKANAEAVLIAKPNAGSPRFEGDKAIYEIDPPAFGQYSGHLIQADVKILGGCCGATPAHIAALKQVIDERETIAALN